MAPVVATQFNGLSSKPFVDILGFRGLILDHSYAFRY